MDISKVIAGWQTKLLQLDRRNSLLYFRNARNPQAKSGAVGIVGTGPDALLDRLQRSRIGLSFPYAEQRKRTPSLSKDERDDTDLRPGDLETDCGPGPLQSRLLGLHRKEREWKEEQGVNVLFVALGFLNWIDFDGDTAQAPLLLVPADLERDSPRDPWRLKLEEDDIQINATLRYQLSLFGVEFPEYGHDAPSAYLREIVQRISPKKNWSVEPVMALATFPFAKMAMWEDLDEMSRQGTEHPVVRALAGNSEALRPPRDVTTRRLPPEEELEGGGLDSLLPVKEQFTVLPADHSQLRAIELARRGAHLVVHGPPGTGKSQTIANIIATFLADGKKILFVSEKTAALDVVKQRLEDHELGSFCLDLHSKRASKASVYQQIREAIEAPRTTAASFPLDKLEGQRERLNSVARALHERRSPLGLSVFEVHGRYARIRSLQRVDFPLRQVGGLTSDDLDRIGEATARIARRRAEFEAHQTSPWRSLRRTSPGMDLPDELRRAAATMRGTVMELQASGVRESEGLGWRPPKTPKEAEIARRIAGHMVHCPGIPEIWLSGDALSRLERRAKDLATMQSERRSLEKRLALYLGSPLPALDFQELRLRLGIPFKDEQLLRDALGAAWSERLSPPPEACEQNLRIAIDRTRRLREAALLLIETLAVTTRLDRASQVRLVAQRVRTALATTPVPEAWFEPGGFSFVRTKLDQARAQLTELEQAERGLFKDFEEDLLTRVSPEMLIRYRTDHQSLWRTFRKSYRDDQRALRGSLRRPRKLPTDEALSVVESALRVRGLQEKWLVDSAGYAAAFGARFSGRSTSWQELAATVAEVESWVQSWEWGSESARHCFSAEQRNAVESRLRELEAAFVEWQESALAVHGADADSDLAIRQNALEAGIEIVARLVRDGSSLWPNLRGSLKDWGQLVELLSEAVKLRRIKVQDQDLAPDLRKDFEGYYEGPDSDWQNAQSALGWARGLLDVTGGRVSHGLSAQCRQPRPPEQYAEQEQRLATAISAFQAKAIDFSLTFDPRQVGWDDWEIPEFERLTSWLGWLVEHADGALAWLEYSQAVRDLEALLAPGVVNALREVTENATQVPDLVLRRVYAAWIDHMREKDPRLQFHPRDHEALREEFRKLDRSFVQANRARIRAKCFRGYPDEDGPAIQGGQLGKLNHQLSLKRRQMPVRKLIREVPLVLQALKPCFLMSPVAVSQYLSRPELATDSFTFDAVIFDEASQIFPEDAVPAIARARQVIVVGDRKQLPPTSFFRREVFEDDDDEPTADRLEGVESILDVMVGMAGGGVQSAYLGVHYRSRHEHLIRYSNHHFYEDRLLTFPSPDMTGSHGLKDIYLPDGRYDAGASRTNQREAETAVEQVFKMMRTCPESESIGVVALSKAQADRIEEMINERRLQDSSLDSRFAEDRAERFFVKNLENVQGDERDHIILSLGYGPTVGSGAVPNRFGPINREGGERRLNVAVTRARQSLTLIRSLRPEQITSETEGTRLFRRFLEYAQDPVRAFEQVIDVDPAAESESPFEEAVYRAMTERGHKVSRQVGCFGYRIDLAIAAEDGSRYDLGIECDGRTYHSTPAARDRDWLRQDVLEGLGWTIHRIWSTDWIKDPKGQIQAVEAALARARAKVRDGSHRKLEVVQKAVEVSEAPRPIGSPKKEFRFAPYKSVELPRHHREVPIQQATQEQLRRIVTRVVEAEGPVHVDVLIDRIRRHYGAGRAGSQIQAAIMNAVRVEWRADRISWRGDFLSMPQHPSRPEPRGPAQDGKAREIEHIWQGEIEAGIIRVVEAAFGISRDHALVATARAFGYDRAGSKVQEAIRRVLDRLIANGEIDRTPTGLTIPSNPPEDDGDEGL